MHRIEPYLLWLGNAGDARNTAAVVEADIEAIVQLAMEEFPPFLSREVVLLRVPLMDGSGNAPHKLRLAIELVTKLISSQRPVLVCCSAGMSRSPAIIACALAIIECCSPQDCLARLAEQTPIDVSPGLWQELASAIEIA